MAGKQLRVPGLSGKKKREQVVQASHETLVTNQSPLTGASGGAGGRSSRFQQKECPINQGVCRVRSGREKVERRAE